MQDDWGGSDGTPPGVRGLGYHPGPPRIFPPVRIPPSPPGIRAGRPVAVSPECHGPDRLRPNPTLLGEEVCPVWCVLWWKGEKGFRSETWNVGWMRYLAGSWSWYVLGRDRCSRDSASCMAGGGRGPGSTARTDRLAGIEGGLTDGHLQRICASALHAGDGCVLSPIPSHSLGTSSPQLEPPRAPPSRGRAGAGNRVCIEMV